MTNGFPISPPGEGEFAPFYAGYVERGRRAGDLRHLLTRQVGRVRAAVEPLTDAEALSRYAPGKWTVKEVLGHMADAERIFSYRLLRIARGDETPLAGFEENAYVRAAGSDALPASVLLDDLDAARRSTLSLLGTLSQEALARAGRASEQPVSARALLYILAGHVEHHLGVLSERYGVG